jgi:hypothetical protein
LKCSTADTAGRKTFEIIAIHDAAIGAISLYARHESEEVTLQRRVLDGMG